jgi:hypothetical protein
MKTPIALVSGLLLPLAYGNIGCINNGEQNIENNIEINIHYNGNGENVVPPSPQPGNTIVATEGGEARTPDGSVVGTTSSAVSGIVDQVATDGSAISGTATASDGSTLEGVISTYQDSSGGYWAQY